MKYCVDNSLCPFKRQNGSIMECSAVEYCSFQRPNALDSHNPYCCTCSSVACSTTSKRCLVCGGWKGVE